MGPAQLGVPAIIIFFTTFLLHDIYTVIQRRRCAKDSLHKSLRTTYELAIYFTIAFLFSSLVDRRHAPRRYCGMSYEPDMTFFHECMT